MAVDPDVVDDLAANIASIYREAETALVQLVTRHLAAGLDSPAAERRLGGLRALRRGAQAIIAALEADTGPVVRESLAQAYRHGWTSALANLPERWFARSGIGQAAREALKEIPGFGFVEALAQALTADFGQVHNNMLRNVMDAFRSVQAAAAARILTGVQTRRQASQSAWQRLVDRGITSFVDRAGRRWQLSSYVEMAARTNAQRAATTAQVDRLTTLGVELVYVSDSPQECKLCRPFEGKILRTTDGPLVVVTEHATRDIPVTVTAYATLDQARARGLFHPNCRHSISAYLPGVTRVPQNTQDPGGDEARQRQRALERRIRQHKEREQAALTDEARALARKRVRAAQADLRAHLAAHPGLKRLRYREEIGAGNIPPGRSGPAAGDLGGPVEPTLDGGPAPTPERRTRRTDVRGGPPVDDRRPGPGQPELEAPPAPRARDVRDMSDEELEQALMSAMEAEDFDVEVIDRLSAEVDRREVERKAAQDAAARPAPVPDADELTDAQLRVLPDDVVTAMATPRQTGDFLDDLLANVGQVNARVVAELDWREAQRRAAPDPATLTDDELDAAIRAALAEGADPHARDPLAAELDRRDAERQARQAAAEQARDESRQRQRDKARRRREERDAARSDRLAALLDEGWDEEEAVAAVYGISVERQRRDRAVADLREQGYTGRGFDELARAAYRDFAHRQWLAAEQATRGVLVTRAGQAAGIDPRSLFTGPEARARKWASDELKGWWDEHGRMTLADYKAGLLGGRGSQSGRDFLT